jgi:heme oxygenase
VSAPPWMLLRLALETHVHHARADEDRLAAMDIKSVADYRAFLLRVWGFEAAIEHVLVRLLGDDPVVAARCKTQRLREDLIALGVLARDVDALPSATLNIRSAPQALGSLFVIERHTLLSGLIARHVRRTLGDELDRALRYLSAYGDTPGAHFRELGDTLGTYAWRYTPSAIVAGANDAFRAQRHWYEPALEVPVVAVQAIQEVRHVDAEVAESAG